MVVIKDGEVSGIIPSNEVFTVHYPGYPSSVSRAIQALGGNEAILQVRASQSNKLKLRFRPEDPYSHPASGKLRACNSLLLKITKKKHGSSSLTNEQETESQVIPELSADIVARIPEFYQFEGMVDYQHVVAVHADTAGKKKRTWTEMKQPLSEKAGLMDLDQEDVMSIVPPLFSLKDIPVNLALKPPPISSSRRKQEEFQEEAVDNHFEMNIEPSLAIDFDIKEIPKEINWKAMIAENSELYLSQMAVSELFEERPIWPKDSLTERLLVKNMKFTLQTLRRLLVAVAYYFSRGPFRRFWIRKGYDPRKDPDSRIYQRMDFRVPPPLKSFADDNAADSLRHKWGDLCKFQVFPHKSQTSFQLCELDDDYIQQEIKKPPKQTTCTFGTGWFSPQVHDSFRCRVMMRFIAVYPKSGAAKLLKAASEDFEKSKKACMYKSCLKPAEEHQKSNKEVVADEANAIRNDIDEGEADDIEADDHEDELDADEELDPAGEDDETCLQSHSYMENNSRSYLQDLFDSFPSSHTDGAILQDAYTSDGEYQIYEQDDYDDDEDCHDDDDNDG